jgi:uncharacterized protein (DUF849 family)
VTSKAVAKRVAAAKVAAEKKRIRERRGRALMIAGAVLILLTYTVKEVFREELKGFSDSIAAAQLAEDTGDTQQIISERQMAMSLQLRHMQEALVAPNANEVVSKAELQMDIADLSQAYADLAGTVDRVNNLLDKFPRWVRGREQAQKEMKASLDKAHEVMIDTITKNQVAKPDIKNHLMVLMGLLQVEIEALQVAGWQDSVTKHAKKLRDVADKLAEFCTWAAFALVAIGVILALIGKLHGYEVVEYET